MAAGYLLFGLLGPNGVPLVLERRRQIRDLREQNSDLQRQIQETRDRIQSFTENAAERERRVREDLGKLRKGEVTFLLPKP